MTQVLVVLVAALAVIAASAVLGPRLRLASPLLLVAVGVAASFAPLLGDLRIEPEWILEGVLPPLLYSSAVSMPAMNFRREFGAISALSVVLVVVSALVLGAFFALVIPGLGFAWGVALGAIVSPTDAVATAIIRGSGVSKRAVALLDGESLLNDATALVLLRAAIVATAASFSFWDAVGSFVYSVAIASAIGAVIGVVNLLIRKRISDPTVNTIVSFTVPFAAAVPAGLLGASGLVAAVVAGVITGARAPRLLSPQNRLSDSQNWRTVELVLEGAVFLTLGLQLKEIVGAVEEAHAGVLPALLIAVGALVLVVAVRAGYVGPLLALIRASVRRSAAGRDRLVGLQERLNTPEGREETARRATRRGRAPSERRLDSFATRVTRYLADLDYFLREPLGAREGVIVVWAGMRGAVTVAAAQTLPADTPQRPVLVLVAFAVAVLSLALQGGTIGALVRRLAPPPDPDAERRETEERTRLFTLLKAAGDAVGEAPERVDSPDGFRAAKAHRLAVLRAQRTALLDARDDGTFDADVLEHLLTNLDASEIDLQLRGQPVEG